jgi:hypothetical protein
MPKIIRVQPIGTRKAAGFVCPGGFREWDEPVYPPSSHADEVRDARLEGDRNLRQGARLLGITAEQMSGLEFGRYTFATEVEWQQVLWMLRNPGTGGERK